MIKIHTVGVSKKNYNVTYINNMICLFFLLKKGHLAFNTLTTINIIEHEN